MKKLAVGRWPLAVFTLFLAARLPLLFLRQPFFDELYTRWIAAKSFAGVLEALRFDSGPPLYYWLLQLLGHPPLLVMRAISLLCAAIAVALVARSSLPAAALLAVFPPAVLFAVDARAYALCGMLVVIAMVALERERPWIAVGAIVLAAYSHYYGVLFFPLLFRRWRALAVAVVLYIPGFWLALHQPAAARSWMNLAWPDALFVRPPLLLAIAIALLVIAAITRTRIALWTLIPLAAALVIGAYVPMRFESVVAAPLMLWLAASRRRVVLIGLGAAFAAWTALGIADHAVRPPDDYRAAATWLARNVPAAEPVVASGYLYLETIAQRPATAFPPEQALHPGWRAVASPGSPLPPRTFLWIGERNAPELQLIRRVRRVDPIYMNSRAIVLKVN